LLLGLPLLVTLVGFVVVFFIVAVFNRIGLEFFLIAVVVVVALIVVFRLASRRRPPVPRRQSP
jgi:FtsH-binding integral membrane protein